MTDSTDRHSLSNGRITAAVKADGAELCSLRDGAGNELLWQAGPAWPRHAPVLFPIVGRLAGDTLRHDGAFYRLTQHGFARDRRFTWEERSPTRARLSLSDDEATRALYPFAFRLELDYALDGDTLTVTHHLTNTGEGELPASLGAHPAFRWPLRDGLAKETHELFFEAEETEAVRRVGGGLLTPEPHPSPVEGCRLPLDEALFAADALIFDRPASRSVRYMAPGGPTLTVAWEGFRELGLWSKPGGDFLCIEPWYGHASPRGFDGDFRHKPGLMRLAPGEERLLTWSVTVG